MNSPIRWHHSLAARFGAAFVVFVVVGSSLLLAWLRHLQQEESERVFTTLVRTDADFIKRLNLPRSAKLAADLHQLLGLDIHFRDASGQMEPPLSAKHASALANAPARTEVYHLPDHHQALILHLDERHDILFVRKAPTPTLSLLHPATRNALLAFWILSAALGWIVSRQVLHPIGTLIRQLPGFFTRSTAPPPEAKRPDEIGQLARALSQARDQLLEERLKREQSERLALLGRVATGLAHEIKNPLASIQLHADLMESPTLDAESARSLQHMRAEAKVIEGLVNQWLFLTRPAPPQRAPLDLTECVEQTLQTLRGQAEHAGVTLIGPVPLSEGTLQIRGDRSRLLQAFRNIILNGIQAMPRGGDIRITVEKRGPEARILIRDAGPGFSKAALKQGTDLFFSEREGGMGVGLNVVSEIIFAHNGKMMLKNCPTGGAVVDLRLPLDPCEPQSPSLV